MDKTCALAVITPSNKILIVKPTNASWNKPVWGFPKGLKDENEVPVKAAIRELYEETCLDLSHYCDKISDFGEYPYTNEKDYHLFAVRIDREIDVFELKCTTFFTRVHPDSGVSLEFPEVDGFQMVPLDGNLINLLNKKQAQIVMSLVARLKDL